MSVVLPAGDAFRVHRVDEIRRESGRLGSDEQPAVVRCRIADRESLYRVVERASVDQLAKRLAFDLAERRDIDAESACGRRALGECWVVVLLTRHAASLRDEFLRRPFEHRQRALNGNARRGQRRRRLS